MSQFINQLLHRRHAQTAQMVQPRMRSKFEPVDGSTKHWKSPSIVEDTTFRPPSRQAIKTSTESPDRRETVQEDSFESSSIADHPRSSLKLSEKSTLLETAIRSETITPPPEKQLPTIRIEQSDFSRDKSTFLAPQVERSNEYDPQFLATNSSEEQQQADTAKNQKTEKKYPPTEQPIIEKTQFVQPALPTLIKTPLSNSNRLENSKPAQTPTIKVNIERIEVRAIMPKKTAPLTRKRTTPKPRLSLEDYLKKQNNR